MGFTMRKTRSSSKKQKPKQNAANVEKNVYKKTKKIEQIRMATDIWAEQYQYGGGEIKWPVIKRNGWFMAIPRLKLPKGNKFRYSHKERKAKQDLIQKEKEKKTQKIEMIKEKEQEIESVVGGNNVQWDMFMDAINAKEAELAQSEMKEQSKNVKKRKRIKIRIWQSIISIRRVEKIGNLLRRCHRFSWMLESAEFVHCAKKQNMPMCQSQIGKNICMQSISLNVKNAN